MKNALTFSYIGRKIAAVLVFAISLALVGNVANAAKRVALVIGNSAYVNAAPLRNPRNDAEDLAKKLEGLGFEVVGGFDLDSRGMRDKVREFGQKLRGAEVAMFFYAGHALQVNGRNFLAPVNTDIRHEGDLDFETIPMDFVQRQMERETKTVLLFLDACRDNPLARNLRKSSRSTGSIRGLAREAESSEGTFIAFATQPNNVALDGDGRNSPFTTALLANIDRPGVEISTLMTDVRRQVFEQTDEQQIPWINSSLLGRFYFKGNQDSAKGKQVASADTKPDTLSDVSTQAQTPEENKPALQTKQATSSTSTTNGNDTDKLLSMRLEQMAWEAVKDSQNVDELEAYVNAYGTGFFGDLAKLRLARIAKTKATKLANLEKSDSSRKINVEKVLRDNPDEATKTTTTDEPISIDEEKPAVTTAKEEAPKEEAPKVVTRETTRQIQAELNRLGCVAGSADGLWGKKSIKAVSAYSKHAKVRVASIRPTHELLRQLQQHKARVCPGSRILVKKRIEKSCGQGQKLSSKGNCYWPKVKQATKTCQPGQKLSSKGNCYWPKVKQATKTCQSGQKLSRKGNCYWPKVKQATKTCRSGQKLSRKGNCYWPKVKQATKTCQPGQRLSSKGNCYWPRQQQTGVVVQQPRQRQPQVIRQHQPQVIIQQPQPRQNRSGLLGGAIGGVILNCALGGC